MTDVTNESASQCAYEIKYSENLFRENKYKFFRGYYPSVPFKLISMEPSNKNVAIDVLSF